jgi:hypothetical protein
MIKPSQQSLPSVAGVSANPLEHCGRHRVNNMNPEADLEADGWGNGTTEAYTGKSVGHRAERTRLKVDIAP